MLDTIDQKMNDWNGSLFVYIDFDHFIILEFCLMILLYLKKMITKSIRCSLNLICEL